ncbi:MAG TPA: serine/threonine-protein kinase [Candidatus Aminicenantes bacterium]|nr:serine/threonine-protein kinase [Candidatus Aminicenantes bacterium]HRY63900.1 serine/threonine-protein kinase [Candidatus Aminicenantes bacterium]HRZ70813.1 serine/threonine-protein kinase [Candidatus Aminicenantes bacterium]
MVGTVLKHYRIETQLGKGGMGVVYRARDTRLDRPVALKMIPPGLIENPERRSRLLLEARSAAAVSHPAIAQVYDIDEADGNLFIAMEYVDGRTVTRLIADGELDLMGAIEIALQVAEGLAKAHDAGILHRDIKSDNIMVTRDGHAKLLDFGLAKLVEPEPDEPVSPAELSRTLTRGRVQTIPGAVMGTLSYMSPEQARGKELDRRSDIFSLGIVLYEMVTSELPFKGETPLDTMHAIAYEEARPLTLLRRNLTPEIHRIVFRCLRKNPEDRYPDAHALAADLRRLKHDLETGTAARLPVGDRLRVWAGRFKGSFPGGTRGMVILLAAIALGAVLVAVRFDWGGLIGPAFIALFVYRFVRNRKKRLIAAFTRKVSRFPEVRLVAARDDRVTVVMDKAPAKVYIRITALVDELNRSLFIGKDVRAEIRTDITEAEASSMLTRVGVLYAREEGGAGSGSKPAKGKTRGGPTSSAPPSAS